MLFNILREEFETQSHVLDKSSAVLFMWNAIQQVKGDLIWFKRSAGHFAFAEKMFNTINQLSSSMVDFDTLEKNTKSEITRKKMHDIVLIRGAYKKLIADYTDSSGVLGWLIENIRHSKIIKSAKVFITGFQHLSIQRGAVVTELIKHAGEFTAGYQNGSEFEEMIAGVVLNSGIASASSEILPLRYALCQNDRQLRNFDTLQDEAAWVANEICRLVKIDGVRFRDIVVVASDYETSAKVFEQVFAENGIEVNLDVGADLLSHSLTQFLREYLLLAATGGQVHFLNVIKSAYSGLNAETEFETENNALKNGTRGNEITAPIVKKLVKCKTVGEFCTVLASHCEERSDEAIQVRKLLDLLETLSKISGNQNVSPLEFINLFTALTSATKVSDIPTLADAVLLVSVPEYQPTFVPYVFVTGASDGAFPVTQDDTDIITTQDIANTNIRIEPSATLQNSRNRRHAIDIITSATEKLYISNTGQHQSELIEKLPITCDVSEVASKTFATNTVLKAIGDGTAFDDAEYYGNVLKSLDLGGLEYLNPKPKVTPIKSAQKLFFQNGTARVTQIENFRKCPYFHFLENGLNVRVRERNKLAANIMGTVIHKLAEEFTKKIITAGREGLENFDAEAEMKKVAEQVLYIEEFRFLTQDTKNAPVISNLKKEAKLLAREIIRQVHGSKYFPKYAETPIQGEIEGVVVRGKADRIDVDGTNHAIIIDYKTGAIDKASLQLPLYIEFLQDIYTTDGAFYQTLRPGKFDMQEAKVPDAKQQACEIISKIKGGVIRPNPADKKVCRYCVARDICFGGVVDEEN